MKKNSRWTARRDVDGWIELKWAPSPDCYGYELSKQQKDSISQLGWNTAQICS